MEMLLPIGWDTAGRAWRWLTQGMMLWSGEFRAGEGLLTPVVPEPVLSGFEAANDRMARLFGVPGRVLGR